MCPASRAEACTAHTALSGAPHGYKEVQRTGNCVQLSVSSPTRLPVLLHHGQPPAHAVQHAWVVQRAVADDAPRHNALVFFLSICSQLELNQDFEHVLNRPCLEHGATKTDNNRPRFGRIHSTSCPPAMFVPSCPGAGRSPACTMSSRSRLRARLPSFLCSRCTSCSCRTT